MASLRDPQRMTEDLRTRAEELHAQVLQGEAELSEIVRLADDLGGAADRVAATFDKVNQALEQAEDAPPAPRELTEDLAPAARDEQGSEAGEEVFDRARQADIEIPGRPEATSGNPT